MQNLPLNGNSGTVMHLNLHPIDSNDAGVYPLRLRNVITGGVDGIDRLSGWDSVVYIATRIIHDTTYITLHDTTYIPVHDTTYITLYDTIYITQIDTVVQWQFDTTYITVYDTITEPLIYYHLQVISDDISKGIAAGSGQFPEGTTVEIAAIPLEGYRFLTWSDGSTENPRTIELSNDMIFTAQFSTTRVEEHEELQWYLFAERGSFTVKGAQGRTISVYDVTGRLLHRFTNAPEILRCPISVSGSYLVRVDSGTARKVTVMSF